MGDLQKIGGFDESRGNLRHGGCSRLALQPGRLENELGDLVGVGNQR